MNAIKFLLIEHNRVRRIFKEINKSSRREATKYKMFNKLCNDLIIHETMEHKVWYPSLKINENLKRIIKHLLKEEKKAGKIIKNLNRVSMSTTFWEKKFLTIKADVEHHANEEEKKLFPKVKKLLSSEELEELGAKMRDFKRKSKANRNK